ncbi:MAG: thiosulfate sulfurtransferase GlpE [bacterium]
MFECPEIDPVRAKQIHDEKKALFVDIRDPHSYEEAHIPGALPLREDNLKEFLAQTPKEQTVIVCCYHGISSQGATAFLLDQGFQEVYSLEGGFEEWRARYPESNER